MNIDGWRYYNHAAIPTCAPHEMPNTAPVKDGTIWKMGGGTPLLARWTEQFDCGYETNWWYVIKDTPFDISNLRAKYRYEINKGYKSFEVYEFNFQEYIHSVADVYEAAVESYENQLHFDKSAFINKSKAQGENERYYGAFEKESGKLCAFCYLRYQGQCASYITHKSIPAYEKQSVNAALVAGMLKANSDFLLDGYICDGARSINHKTAFQDYLEKYFDFRKAYCELNIAYNPKVRWIVKLLYPFRGIFLLLDNINIFHQINSVLKTEEIKREND